MHRETDLVALLKDLPELNLHRGDVGTVAFVYEPEERLPEPNQPGGAPPGHLYEVEFMNAAGDTLAVVTLHEAEIRGVELQNVILHVNDRAA